MQKKILIVLLLIMLLCAASGVGEDESFSMWMALLASDEPCPIPKEARIQVGKKDLSLQRELDPQWRNLLIVSTDAPDMLENFGRSDVIFLCSVQMRTGEIVFTPLSGEEKVSVRELPREIPLKYVGCFGGGTLLMRSVNEKFGLNIEKFCAVNESAFEQAVDLLGGVEIILNAVEAEALEKSEGKNLLDGEAALRYARLRQGNGEKRRKAVIEATFDRAFSGGDADGALSIAEGMLPLIDTNVSTNDLIDLILAVCEQDRPQIRFLPGGGDAQQIHAALYGEEKE